MNLAQCALDIFRRGKRIDADHCISRGVFQTGVAKLANAKVRCAMHDPLRDSLIRYRNSIRALIDANQARPKLLRKPQTNAARTTTQINQDLLRGQIQNIRKLMKKPRRAAAEGGRFYRILIAPCLAP